MIKTLIKKKMMTRKMEEDAVVHRMCLTWNVL